MVADYKNVISSLPFTPTEGESQMPQKIFFKFFNKYKYILWLNIAENTDDTNKNMVLDESTARWAEILLPVATGKTTVDSWQKA